MIRDWLRQWFPKKQQAATVLGRRLSRKFRPFLELLEDRTTPTAFTVSNTGDASTPLGAGTTGSLRQVIDAANLNPGPDSVTFTVSGTITPGSPYQPIGTGTVGTLLIDGSGQNIIVDGTLAGAGAAGFKVIPNAAGSTIQNLTIRNFGVQGILLEGADNNTIKNNTITGNGTSGIDLVPPVGLSTPTSDGNTIQGNIVTGNGVNGGGFGIFIDRGSNNVVGGATAALRNLVSGNTGVGILIGGATATGNTIQGNFIGVNAAGTGAQGNTLEGILVQGASGNTITANVVGRNQTGITLYLGANNNTVSNNFIGTDLGVTVNLGNTQDGINIDTARNNVITGNTIRNNGASGVLEQGSPSSTGNQILSNSIFGNTTAGITQAPLLQTPPTVSSANFFPGRHLLVVEGTVAGAANQTFIFQVFASPSGSQGQTLLGQATITTNAAGFFRVRLTNIFGPAAVITVTDTPTAGTNINTTSPFSNAVGLATQPDLIGVFRDTTSQWYLSVNNTPFTTTGDPANNLFISNFGTVGDQAVFGDWVGDGFIRIGVFRPSTSEWFLSLSNSPFTTTGDPANNLYINNFGTVGDQAAVGDWNGTGVTKVGVFRAGASQWYLSLTNTPFTTTGDPANNLFINNFGTVGDQAAVGDWNNTGFSKVGVFRDTASQWYLSLNNSPFTTTGDPANNLFISNFGTVGDQARVGDWNGTGFAKVGVFRASNSQWYLSVNNTPFTTTGDPANNLFISNFGTVGDQAAVGDWTGSGFTKVGVFRAGNSQWYLSVNNTPFTTTGDPLNNLFINNFGAIGDQAAFGAWFGA
ncbi:MAG: right-handed parallel beta-helix repeat-containing protein [Gemmataceae bacterium]|nr:right-handed parallel beta-helix repeat-containing protein [Gemmataceae bacterium]